MINGIHWWEILIWAVASLFYLALAIHIISSTILDVIIKKSSSFLVLYWEFKGIAKSDKVTPIK